MKRMDITVLTFVVALGATTTTLAAEDDGTGGTQPTPAPTCEPATCFENSLFNAPTYVAQAILAIGHNLRATIFGNGQGVARGAVIRATSDSAAEVVASGGATVGTHAVNFATSGSQASAVVARTDHVTGTTPSHDAVRLTNTGGGDLLVGYSGNNANPVFRVANDGTIYINGQTKWHTGPTGPKGPKGNTGPAGPKGANGSDAPAGTYAVCLGGSTCIGVCRGGIASAAEGACYANATTGSCTYGGTDGVCCVCER